MSAALGRRSATLECSARNTRHSGGGRNPGHPGARAGSDVVARVTRNRRAHPCIEVTWSRPIPARAPRRTSGAGMTLVCERSFRACDLVLSFVEGRLRMNRGPTGSPRGWSLWLNHGFRGRG